ncbi:MAG: HEAT repeat domain-containing protein [Candidatus Sulfotelmatobacter sp.]|jgi:HEAT repeat protein
MFGRVGFRLRSMSVFLTAAVLVSVPAAAGMGQTAAPIASGEQLPVPGRPVPADHSQLSEHNIEWVMTQPPQVQMEFLLGAAINHDHGATDMINKMVEGWHGKVHYTQKFDDLSMTALYSNDLRVRAAAIEITLAVDNLPKTEETADRLMASAEKSPSYRTFATWVLGMLANRGVEPERIHEFLRSYMHDPMEKTRYWTVEGLAHLGTDDTIKDFLDVFRNDPSLEVRERAGCSLAKSGMLTREQRMLAVPGLIDLADDPSLDATTRTWVYQALREITNEHLGNEPAAWRNWYTTAGTKRRDQFRQGEQWAVLGNN